MISDADWRTLITLAVLEIVLVGPVLWFDMWLRKRAFDAQLMDDDEPESTTESENDVSVRADVLEAEVDASSPRPGAVSHSSGNRE